MRLHESLGQAESTLTEILGIPGSVVLEVGASWCGYCRNLAPVLATLMASQPDVRHFKVEDAAGQPLGRFFQVKLWPTLVFLRDGKVVARYVRPVAEEIQAGLSALKNPRIEP